MATPPRSNVQKVRLPRTFRAFQDRNYRLLWPANLLGYMSRWMQMTLLSWLVLVLTDSPWRVALVGFFGMAPMLILGLVGGLLADRLNRKRLLVSTQLAGLTASLVMLALLSLGWERFWHAYVVMAVSGASWALDMPSRRSLIHDMLGSSGVTNAVALDAIGMSASIMMGPALAGVLITVADVTGGYVAVTLAYLAALALMLRVRLRHSPRRAGSSTRIRSDLALGLRYVIGHRTLRATVLVTLLMNLLMFPYFHMVPVIARDVLHVGPALMGMLQSGSGLGSLAGALLIASAFNIRHHGRLYLGGSIVTTVALLLFSASRWYTASLAALVVLGLGTAGFGTMQASLVMLVSREEMRGKALGVVSLAIGAAPLGALAMGAVASAVSPSFALGMSATVGLASLALVWLLMPSLRQRTATEELLSDSQTAPRNGSARH